MAREAATMRVAPVAPILAMRCPICHRDVPWSGNAFRPFCSERCKLIDLDHWLSERYRILSFLEGGEKNSADGEMGQEDKDHSG